MFGLLKGVLGKVLPLAASAIPGIGPLAGAALGAGLGLLTRPKEDPRYAAQQQYLGLLGQIPPPQVAGVNPLSEQGFAALQALGGTPDISAFYNPYQRDVLAGIERDAARQRVAALQGVDDAATRARAFGGTRHSLMAGTALAGVNRSALDAMAAARTAGFDRALQAAQAQQAFQAQRASALMGAGDYLRSLQQAEYDAPFARLQALGPLLASQLATGAAYQPRPSALQSALGGAIAGYGLLRPQTQGQPFDLLRAAGMTGGAQPRLSLTTRYVNG